VHCGRSGSVTTTLRKVKQFVSRNKKMSSAHPTGATGADAGAAACAGAKEKSASRAQVMKEESRNGKAELKEAAGWRPG
jgi:hypothetical protein